MSSLEDMSYLEDRESQRMSDDGHVSSNTLASTSSMSSTSSNASSSLSDSQNNSTNLFYELNESSPCSKVPAPTNSLIASLTSSLTSSPKLPNSSVSKEVSLNLSSRRNNQSQSEEDWSVMEGTLSYQMSVIGSHHHDDLQ